MRQYKRAYSVIVGNDQSALKIDKLRVRFEIEKLAFGKINTCTLHIFNLSSKDRAKITEQFSKLIVNAGYEESGASMIFTGDIFNVNYSRQGADTIATLYASDGGKAYVKSIINKNINEKVTARGVFKMAAATLGGIRIGNIDAIPDKAIYIGNKILSGSTKDVLDDICHTFDCHWQITDGEVNVRPNVVEPIDIIQHEFSSNNGMVGVPTITLTGINVVSLLRPKINPYHTFKIKSEFPNLDLPGLNYVKWKGPDEGINNQACRVLSMKHLGDTHGNEWYTQCTGLFPRTDVFKAVGYG